MKNEKEAITLNGKEKVSLERIHTKKIHIYMKKQQQEYDFADYQQCCLIDANLLVGLISSVTDKSIFLLFVHKLVTRYQNICYSDTNNKMLVFTQGSLLTIHTVLPEGLAIKSLPRYRGLLI